MKYKAESLIQPLPIPFVTLRRTALVVQWLRIHLQVMLTRVQPWVQEDPTCCKATKSLAPQRLSLCSRAHTQQLLKPLHPRACAPQRKATTVRSPCATRREQPPLSTPKEGPQRAIKTQCGQN